MKRIISRKIPETPPPQRGASDPISGLTGLCVYVFYPNLFLSRSNIIPPPPHPHQKNKKDRTDCPLNKRFSRAFVLTRPRLQRYSVSPARRSRNEEAINSRRNMIYSPKVFYLLLYRRRYLLFVSETKLNTAVLATTRNTSAVAGYTRV